MAVPTGFEPALSALTGPRVWPGYTTGPAAAKSTNGPNSNPAAGANPGHTANWRGSSRPQTYNSLRRERLRPPHFRLPGRAAKAVPDPRAGGDLLHPPGQRPARPGAPARAGVGG